MDHLWLRLIHVLLLHVASALHVPRVWTGVNNFYAEKQTQDVCSLIQTTVETKATIQAVDKHKLQIHEDGISNRSNPKMLVTARSAALAKTHSPANMSGNGEEAAVPGPFIPDKHRKWRIPFIDPTKMIAFLIVVIVLPMITCVTMQLSSNHCTVTFVVVLVWLGGCVMYGFDRVDRRTWVIDKLFSIQKLIANEAYQSAPFDWRHWMFFVCLLLIAAMNLTITIPMLIVFFQRRFYKEDLSNVGLPAIEVSAIVPCYLPNEKDIIETTVRHILENVESPGKLSLWLVYNTPTDMPELEERLQELQNESNFPPGRELHVLRAHQSTSKAENLNYVLPLVTGTYVAVYDADHKPEPDSLMYLSKKLWASQEKYVCVQGSTQIRYNTTTYNILGRIIDAEFFVMHFIYFPLLKELTNCTFFGGSNAVWNRQVLLSLAFNNEVQTEDIDISVRALLDRGTIGICPEARSTELPPNSLGALYRQRLRWAVGWDQVSLRYFTEVNQLPFHQRLGLLHVLYMRWFVHLSGILVGIAMPVIGIVWHFNPATWGVSTVIVQMVLFSFYILIALCAIFEAFCEVNRRHGWLQIFFVAAFLGLNSIYIVLNAVIVCVSLYRICTGHLGEWVVTCRDVPENDFKDKGCKGNQRPSQPKMRPPEPEEEPSQVG